MRSGPDSLAIVTGASSSLGAAYVQRFSRDERFRTVGVSRSPVGLPVKGIDYREGVDLLQSEQIARVMDDIRSREAMRVVLVHSVGKFTFQEFPPADGSIDSDVLHANFMTLHNAVNAIASRLREDARLTVCGFGSVSDMHDVPFWRSYTAAKHKVRGLLKELRGMVRPDGIHANSLMVNVAATDTASMHTFRPYADTAHWLRPEKVAERSMPLLLDDEAPSYREIDVFEPKPGFDAATYFADHAAILARWKRDMGQSQ